MQLLGSRSWQIHVQRAAQQYDLPLWIRAAEGIEAAGALVPGPLEIDPPPPPSATEPGPDLAEGWTAWWHAVVRQPRPAGPAAADRSLAPPGFAAPDMSFGPPDFAGLTGWPALHEVVIRRWIEAHEWHSRRKRAAADRLPRNGSVENRVVREVERSLGRPVPPFVVEFVVLPVRDEQVRRVHEGRYLVPERVHDGTGWADELRRVVNRLVAGMIG
jgi:hypothetical protein